MADMLLHTRALPPNCRVCFVFALPCRFLFDGQRIFPHVTPAEVGKQCAVTAE
jgi:hypothetical protein